MNIYNRPSREHVHPTFGPESKKFPTQLLDLFVPDVH